MTNPGVRAVARAKGWRMTTLREPLPFWVIREGAGVRLPVDSAGRSEVSREGAGMTTITLYSIWRTLTGLRLKNGQLEKVAVRVVRSKTGPFLLYYEDFCARHVVRILRAPNEQSLDSFCARLFVKYTRAKLPRGRNVRVRFEVRRVKR